MGTYDEFFDYLMRGLGDARGPLQQQQQQQQSLQEWFASTSQAQQQMQMQQYDYYASLQNAQAQMMNIWSLPASATVSIPERTPVLVRLWRFAKRWYRRLDWWQWDVEDDQ